jgi:tetratricopeptide (TPR) repeat protein
MLAAAAAENAAPPATACDRSVSYILQGRYDDALRQLDDAKTSGAAPADVANLRGLTLMLAGDLPKAIASFDEALHLDATFSPARLNRGIALLRGGDVSKAAAELEKVARDEHSTVRADGAYHLAIALDRLGRAQEAETWLDRAMKLDNELDAALLYTGMLRERRGDLQGAGRAYLDYLEAHPDSPVALLRFGLSAHKAGRIDTARTYLQRVISLDAHSPEAIEARKFLVMWE